MLLLALSFFSIALTYSVVGFGGGSSYLALLALFNTPYEVIPKISLLCNVVVVLGGSIHFLRKGHLSWTLTRPIIVASVPMAYIGGCIPISAKIFYGLLGMLLLVVGLRPLLIQNKNNKIVHSKKYLIIKYMLLGGLIGLISGVVGIGGGIFLAPILLNVTDETPKTIAATTSFFILCNSISGFVGQVFKSGISSTVLFNFWPLFLACIVGGQIGSLLGSGKIISQKTVGYMTAILVIYVGTKTLWRAF